MATSPSFSQPHAQLIRQLDSIARLTDEDKEHLSRLAFHVRAYPPNHDIVRENDRVTECCLVISGLVCRYKMVAGGVRQILSVHLPGDMPDLQSLYLDKMDHSLVALSQTSVGFTSHDSVRAMLLHSPSLQRVLMRHALIDASIFREWIANVGGRNAMMRVGHLICETYVRMRALGIVQTESVEVAMTQAEIGEATGLSPVHVNRVMQQLRAQGLITSSGRVHRIVNWDALRRASDFDAGYLHLRSET